MLIVQTTAILLPGGNSLAKFLLSIKKSPVSGTFFVGLAHCRKYFLFLCSII
jgi:hypothetical protein